jgi:hypothetical protein
MQRIGDLYNGDGNVNCTVIMGNNIEVTQKLEIARLHWLKPVILATQEAEIRKITV